MESAWVDNSPHARFIRKLHRNRVDELLSSPDWLQTLRHNWAELTATAKRFSNVFEERGIDFVEFVIQNTDSRKRPTNTGRSQKKGTPPPPPKYIHFPDEMPISTGRSWKLYYPIQQSFTDKELFLPHDIFQLMMKFVPEPVEPLFDWDYDAETADEIGLAMVKII
jgi:hypothetical protein